MQKNIDFEEYRRSLAQLDLFDEKLNAIKASHYKDVKFLNDHVEKDRDRLRQVGVNRMLNMKSNHYGKKN